MRGIGIGIVVLVLGLGVQTAEGQRRGFGGGGRGGGGSDPKQMQEMRTKMDAIRACPVDAMWAALSFEIEMTEEQHEKVAAAMKAAWDMRSSVFTFSKEHDAWSEGLKRMRDLRKKTDAKVKAALGKDQWKAYEKAVKKLQKAVRQEMPGGRF